MREVSFVATFRLLAVCYGIQQFEETPQYTEVNPGQDAKLVCRVLGKRGQCIWQKDQKVRYYYLLFLFCSEIFSLLIFENGITPGARYRKRDCCSF